MPDFTTLVTLVTDFMIGFLVFVAVGAAIRLMVTGVRRLIRAGG